MASRAAAALSVAVHASDVRYRALHVKMPAFADQPSGRDRCYAPDLYPPVVFRHFADGNRRKRPRAVLSVR